MIPQVFANAGQQAEAEITTSVKHQTAGSLAGMVAPAISVVWNFFAGMGSALEILPPPSRIDGAQTDAEAIAEDWCAVAADLWMAIGLHSRESAELGTPELAGAGEAFHAPSE